VVSLTTFLAALLLLAPGPMKELGSELVWSSYFSTNIWFMKKDGYFDGASIMRPLLHSWSLAVEEQFYIVIPLLLRAVKASRLGRHAVLVVFLILFTLSLGVSVVSASHWPSAGFYLLSSRAWELLCGGLLAVGRFPRCAAFVTEIVAFLGLAAVTTAILLYTGATPYPGSAALLPCLGATALIWAGDQRSLPFVSRLLAMPLPVWIGRISYPLYLWHWPLLVLARFALFHEPDLAERLGLIALSVVLAAATTAYVEQPIRSRRILRSQTPLLGAGIAVLLVLLTLGESAEKTHGFTNRFTGMAKAYLDQPIDQSERYCAVLPHVTMGTGTVCGVGDWRRPGQPDFVVWGDSHARVLIPVFDLLARRYNLHGEVLYHGGCEPLLGVSEPGVRGAECRDFNQTVARSLHLRPGATVFLAGLWGRIAEGREPYGICEGVSNDLGAVVDVVTGIAGANGSHQAFANGLERSLDLLHTLRTNPVLIQDNPCQFTEVPSALAMATAQHRSIAELREKRPVIDHVQAWSMPNSTKQQRSTAPFFCEHGMCCVTPPIALLSKTACRFTSTAPTSAPLARFSLSRF